MPRVRKSSDARRAEIITTTAALLRERGFGIATRDITERLGIASGLLNHYFTWSELRAIALAHVLDHDLDAMLITHPETPPHDAVAHFVVRAVAKDADAIWRLWIDAIAAAAEDAAIAKVLRSVTARQCAGLADVLRAGVAAGAWRCGDPAASVFRLVALHDGLVGFLLSGTVSLTRRDAADHLHAAIALECPGYLPPQTSRRGRGAHLRACKS